MGKRLVVKSQANPGCFDAIDQRRQLYLCDVSNLFFLKWMKDNRIIDAVDEFRPEGLGHHFHHRGFYFLVYGSCHALDQVRTQVRRHNQHRVPEVHGTTMAISQPAVVEYLQQDIENVRMSLLDFVQEDN